MSKHVYISYSTRDAKFVERLSSKLSKSGIRIWFDRAEIEAGASVQKMIERAIEGAAVLLFIGSRNTLKSQWALREVDTMKAKGGKIIPIIIDDFGLTDLPLSLREYQFIDFRHSFEKKFQELLKAFTNLHLIQDIEQEEKELEIKSKGYVFLSYCEEDKGFVSDLKIFFRNQGYAYWDYEESDRDYHNHLFFELENAINNAAATLSVLSPFWRQSKWALKEYFFSEEVGTPIFLLKASPMQPTLAISGVPYIDFTVDKQVGFDKLGRELKRKNL